MSLDERDLRRALDARSGEPSGAFRARLSTALEAGRPVARTTPTLAVVAAVCLAVVTVGVLLLAGHGARVTHGPGPASGPRTQTTPTPAAAFAFGSMAMFGEDGWAVTYQSAGPIADLLRTGDGGNSWVVVTPQIAKGTFIFGFALIDGNRAWLMTANDSLGSGLADLWATADGGQTWSQTTAPAIVFRGALITFSDGTNGWLATPGEPASQYQQQGIVIDRTTDGGKTWQLVAQTDFPPGRSTAGAPSVNCGKQDLSFLNARVGWLTGGCTGGVTFDMTTDGGVTWRAQSLAAPHGATFSTDCEGGPCSLSAPRFVSAGYGYMVLNDTEPTANRSWIYVSPDGGRHWTLHAVPGQGTRVTMVTASVGFASLATTDSAGRWLYRTDDGGTSWQPVIANVQLSPGPLDCVSVSRCWALSQSQAGSSAQLYETTDGGRTWTAMTVG
jgi:photosystem II stability/assembly factor-like uncharacterized protein